MMGGNADNGTYHPRMPKNTSTFYDGLTETDMTTII